MFQSNAGASLPFGTLFEKGLTLGTGQCNVKMYNRHLRDLIISGRAKPSFVVSHEIGLDDAPKAYKKVWQPLFYGAMMDIDK